MKKILKLSRITLVILIVVLCLNTVSTYIFGMTSTYDETMQTTTVDANPNSMLSVISDIVLPMIYPLFAALEKLTQLIMYVFTGRYSFPWADMIIFNRIPFLDINFINPEPGSLFMSIAGNYTIIGETIRNVYFTVLSICISVLGIAVTFNAVKMILATIPSAKARYKEMINTTVLSIVLIFGMHYFISFIFFINEQLVQVASTMSEKILNSETVKEGFNNLEEAEDNINDKLIENFFDKCNVTSLWSPITIVKKVAKEFVNALGEVVDWCKNLWNSVFGEDEDEGEVTISGEDKDGYYDEIFPSKDDFINYFHDESKVGKNGINIAAFLLKDYMYRDAQLSMVAGNDTNKFNNAGPLGWLQSFSNTVFWFTGIIDTGLLGLQNLYNSVFYIYNELPDKIDLSTAAACQARINEYTELENNATSDNDIIAYHVNALFCKAYYRYVYEGNDKESIKEQTSLIQNLGSYFKRNIYYIDVDSGEWSSTKFDAITCILYCVFVLQSFMFLFSYVKRLFYVIILALLGPVTVLFDYLKRSY